MTCTLPIRLQEILRMGRALDASDVHLTCDGPPVFRIHGELDRRQRDDSVPVDVEAIVGSCFSESDVKRLQKSGDATVVVDSDEYGSVRIHGFVVQSHVSLAIRLLAQEIPSSSVLGIPPSAAAMAFRDRGLVLIAGPTGCGKSTALAAMIGEINRTTAKHIVTIEDPIEYRHAAERCVVSQRVVGMDVPSFADAVAGALRSDPDVIMLGEMRDRDTMHAAITAVETGHLVLGTLHTGNAGDSVERIIGSFPGEAQPEIRTQLAETLVGVICLRLVKRAGGDGRRAAAEVLVANDAVRTAIRDAKPHHLRNIIATGRNSGMQTLEWSLSELVALGEIRVEEARRVSDRPEELSIAEIAE